MDKRLKKLDRVFEPKSIVVIGASSTPAKVGNVVMKNFIDGGYAGDIYPVNPKYEQLLGFKCYKSVKDIKAKIDCVIIATPAKYVPMIVKECGQKKVGGIIILSGGFEEVGNKDIAAQVRKYCEKYELPCIGPNCLGILNPYSRVDSIFLPMYKLQRPNPGGISFITQSGAVGSTIVDLVAHYGMGLAKFISYGNATVLDEGDLLEYLANDDRTEIIILYVEGAKDGKKLLKQMKKVNKKKPIIVLKAGKYGKAKEAAMSHTGNVAGDYMAYKAAFRQARVTEAEGIDELFDFVKIFSQTPPKGKKVGIVTNGGGMGVLTSDAIEKEGLQLGEFSKKTQKALRKILPSYGTVANPLDLIADAGVEAYEKAIDILMDDKDIDSLIIVVLTQTPPIDERILGILTQASDDRRKPIVTISVGGTYTQAYQRALESKGVPSYGSPNAAVTALKRFIEYSENRKKM